MKWVKALLGVAVIGGFVWVATQIKSKKLDVPFIEAPEPPTVAKDGTKIDLLLMTPLDSGHSEPGTQVKLIVNSDIKGSNGKTLIKQGSIALGEVTESREGTLVGSLTNKPSRLRIKFDSVKMVTGKSVKLRDIDPQKDYEFTQKNTSLENKVEPLGIMSDEQARGLVVTMAQNLAQGKSTDPKDQLQIDTQLSALANKYGLKDTQKFLKSRESEKSGSSDLMEIMKKAQMGDVKGLTGVDILLAARSANEILELGASLDKSLRGIFKGSNIHAKFGTPVTAYLGEDVSEKIKTPKK